MGMKISEAKYVYDKDQIISGNYRIPASNYENAAASMSPRTIASLGFCIAKLNDIIEYDSETRAYTLKQNYSCEINSETTFVGAIYYASYHNKQLLFAWYDDATSPTFSGLSNLNVFKRFKDGSTYYSYFVKGIATLPDTYYTSNLYIDIAFDYNEDDNTYSLSAEYGNLIYVIDKPLDCNQQKYGCQLLELFDINYITGEVIPKTVFYKEHFDYLQQCSYSHKPYYITSNSYYDGCIVANVCNYSYIQPQSYLLSFTANFDNNQNGGDQRLVWNHAVCFKIHIEPNSQGNHDMELVYDIDLQKVQQSIKNKTYEIPTVTESGTTVLDDDVDVVTNADYIELTNTGAIYHRMLDTSSVIWFAYWNMVDDIVAQYVIQYDKAIKELKLLPANALSSDIVELPNGALDGDTITDDNLNILKQADGKIIYYSNYFYQCSVFGNDILLNGLTSGFNIDSTPVLFSSSYLISGEIKDIDNYTGIIYLKLNENGIYLDSTGNGTKFLADDGTYKTINTTEGIPVVTLQMTDDSIAQYGSATNNSNQFTINQEDFEKLSSFPKHVFFKTVDSRLILGTLAIKPNIITQTTDVKMMFYATYGAQITIQYTTASDVTGYFIETLNLPIGDNQHFYNSAGNSIALTNVISLSSSDTVILDRFNLHSPVIPLLLRTLASGKSVSYTLDSIASDDVAKLITFRKTDYTTDQLNIVTIKLTNTENNTLVGELISDKTYALTPKTE